MKTEITIQQPLAGGPWAYMVTRNGRPIAWGDAGTKRQALNEAATACGFPLGRVRRLVDLKAGVAIMATWGRAAALVAAVFASHPR